MKWKRTDVTKPMNSIKQSFLIHLSKNLTDFFRFIWWRVSLPLRNLKSKWNILKSESLLVWRLRAFLFQFVLLRSTSSEAKTPIRVPFLAKADEDDVSAKLVKSTSGFFAWIALLIFRRPSTSGAWARINERRYFQPKCEKRTRKRRIPNCLIVIGSLLKTGSIDDTVKECFISFLISSPLLFYLILSKSFWISWKEMDSMFASNYLPLSPNFKSFSLHFPRSSWCGEKENFSLSDA